MLTPVEARLASSIVRIASFLLALFGFLVAAAAGPLSWTLLLFFRSGRFFASGSLALLWAGFGTNSLQLARILQVKDVVASNELWFVALVQLEPLLHVALVQGNLELVLLDLLSASNVNGLTLSLDAVLVSVFIEAYLANWSGSSQAWRFGAAFLVRSNTAFSLRAAPVRFIIFCRLLARTSSFGFVASFS